MEYPFVKRVNPSVNVEEIDKSERLIEVNGHACVIIGPSTGPTNNPVYIGPSISKPKWYQFWRWHLIPRYNREYKEAKERFIELFGQP